MTLAESLTTLARRLDAGELPSWMESQIATALEPLQRAIAKLPPRLPAPPRPFSVSAVGAQCPRCDVWCESATAMLHHQVRMHEPPRLRIVAGGRS